MERSVLVVSRQPEFMLGMTQALLKFGYRVEACGPSPASLDEAVKRSPDLVVVSPPTGGRQRRDCLERLRTRFVEKGVRALVWVPAREEGAELQATLKGVHVLSGSPLSLNDLYSRLQLIFALSKRRELRISTELAAAAREAGRRGEDTYTCDQMTSLSVGGCFIRRASPPPPLGRRVELLFCPGVSSPLIHASARICHHGHGPALEGMGLAFEDLDLTDRALIEAYLLTLAATPVLPATL